MGWLIFVAAVFVVVVAPVLSLVAECEWSATAPPFDEDGATPGRARARDAGERIQSNVQTMGERNHAG